MEVRAVHFTSPHHHYPFFLSAFAALAVALLPLACDAPPGQTALVNWETPHVHPIDLTPNAALLLAVNTPDNRLELFAANDDGLSPLGAIPVGLDPVTVRARSNTEAWVVNHISDSISIVDLESRQVVATLRVGDEPCDVVFAGSPQRAFVSLSQENRIRVYNPDELTAEPATLDIEGQDPRALAVAPDGSRVYAAIFESGNATTLVPHYDVSNPDGPYGGQNPPPNAGADFAPAIAPSAINPPPVGQIVRKIDGHWIDINGADWSAKVFWDLHDHDVAIIDVNTLDIAYAAGLMNIDMNLAVHPSGSVTVIGSEALNEIRFEPNLRGTFARMVMATFDPLVPDSAVIRDLNPHLDYTKSSIPNNQRKRSISDPRSIVWNAAGSRAYIAGMGSDNVVVIDEFGDRIAEVAVPAGPTGLALDESRNRLMVLSRFDASVTTIDTGGNAIIETLAFFDPTPEAIRRGRPHLYNATKSSSLGQVSCASCHVDARMDQIAWDLGDPAGAPKEFNQPCSIGAIQLSCKNWHPMKGPMTTQTLVGTIGTRPLHWRGDRENLAAFGGAFMSLMGSDHELPPIEMDEFEAFLATIAHPPNPHRRADNSLLDEMIIRNRIASPSAGLRVFRETPSDRDLLKCVDCHGSATGALSFVVGGQILAAPQQAVVSPLGSTYEKAGFDLNSRNNSRGFGFTHDGAFDTIENFLKHEVFTLPTDQHRLDLEAFVLSFSTETHAAVGMQVTLPGSAASAGASNEQLSLLRRLADEKAIGLVAHGRIDGAPRGYAYLAGGGIFQSDRANETIAFDVLVQFATSGNPLTFTAVPVGTEIRIGIDRDNDGLLDADDAEPANPNLLDQQINALSRLRTRHR